jgi:hypothetical protein
MFNRHDFMKRYGLTPELLGHMYAKRVIPEPLKIGEEFYWREVDIRRFDKYLLARAKCRERGINPDSPRGPAPPVYSTGCDVRDIRAIVASQQERKRRTRSKTLRAATEPIEQEQVPALPEPSLEAVEK